MIGNEGMVGMPMALGIGNSSVRALVQGGGSALRMTAARFRAELKKNLPLQRALFRYTHLLMAQISQTAACNRFHEAEARLARWLAMTSDRVHADQFRLTHEFLAHMLGVRRVGVTQAAMELQRKNLINYSRGHIRILDRKGLEAAACSCYRIVKDLQDTAQYNGSTEISARSESEFEPETATRLPLKNPARRSSVNAARLPPVFADLIADDAADRCTANRPDRASARQYGTTDSTGAGANCGIPISRRHFTTTTQTEQRRCGNRNDSKSSYAFHSNTSN
jgi:hypothetical protein